MVLTYCDSFGVLWRFRDTYSDALCGPRARPIGKRLESMSAGIQTSSVNDKIPVIDLAVLRRPLRDADAKMRAVMLERLGEACSSCGVFYVENHGVPETIRAARPNSSTPFSTFRPKTAWRSSRRPARRAARAPGGVEGQLNDSFHCVFGVEEFPSLEALLNTCLNRWPSRPAGLEATVRETMSALHRLGVDEEWRRRRSPWDFPPQHFDPMVGASHGSFRARRYPPQRDQQGVVGTDAHVDGLALAFIVQNDVPGLQRQGPGVGWTAIEPRPGMLVCQLGASFRAGRTIATSELAPRRERGPGARASLADLLVSDQSRRHDYRADLLRHG